MIKQTTVIFNGRSYLFAKGNLLENIKLWWAGFRYHETSNGWCMIKEISDKDKEEV